MSSTVSTSKRLLALAALLGVAALARAGVIVYSENISAAATSASSLRRIHGGATSRLAIAGTAQNNLRARFSRDYLPDDEFEQGVAGFADVWDDSNNLRASGPWGGVESGAPTLERETTNAISNTSSVRFENSAVTALGSNMDLETWVGDDAANWTEVQGGTATVTSEEVVVMTGSTESAALTGGTGAAEIVTDSIAVTPGSTYVINAWGRLGAAADLMDLWVREVTGGDQYLADPNTWQVASSNNCRSVWSDAAAFLQCSVGPFTIRAGVTAIEIRARVSVSGDIGYLDNVRISAFSTTELFASTTANLTLTGATAYTLGFSHNEGNFNNRLRYSISNRAGAGGAARWWDDAAGAWTATETWNEVTNVTANTDSAVSFGGDSTATGVNRAVMLRFQEYGNSQTDVILDRVFIHETAAGADPAVVLNQALELVAPYPGRWAVIASGGATTVSLAEIQ